MIKDKLEILASRLFSTKPDDLEEPYILTSDEEAEVVANDIKRLKDHKVWKMQIAGLQQGDILQKIASIDWNSEIDRENVLRRANSNKHYDLWQKGQREKEALESALKAAELKEAWTANQFYKLMCWSSKEQYRKTLIVNEETLPLIKTLCFFLSSDPRFETEFGYSLNKGLLIRGVSGLGKTHLVKCVSENPLSPISVLSMIEISDEIKQNGAYEIQPGRKIIYLDDVGTEETPINHFGTKINWFKDFIELYYSKNRPFRNLLISTNNSFSELEDKYGFRVRSRIKDMFNVVDVTGTDLRGKV